MTNKIIAIHVVDVKTGSKIATLYNNSSNWTSPIGERFPSHEEQMFCDAATGNGFVVVLNAGTPKRRIFDVRVEATLM